MSNGGAGRQVVFSRRAGFPGAPVSSEHLVFEVGERLERIELQEDIWKYCLDTLKWDTKKIVCERAYLDSQDQLPPPQQKTLERLRKRFEKRS